MSLSNLRKLGFPHSQCLIANAKSFLSAQCSSINDDEVVQICSDQMTHKQIMTHFKLEHKANSTLLNTSKYRYNIYIVHHLLTIHDNAKR